MRNGRMDDQVVVIVGASSGLGRATAHAFARRGATLVLAARGERPLQEVVGECRRLGGEAFSVVGDATDIRDMIGLAQIAVDLFGGIDVWINNAGTGAVGDFLDTPMPAHEQVIRTNLMGPLNGAYAAMPVFERQGHGVLINVNSVGAWSPTPYSVAYGASKAGLRGLTRALRAEYSDCRDIHVCAIYPTFLDTPGLRHGANYAGKKVSLPPGAWDVETIAERIVHLARHPRASHLPGILSRLTRLSDIAAPHLTETISGFLLGSYLKHAEEVPVSDGVLFEPDETVTGPHGDWPRSALPMGAAIGIGALGLAAAAFIAARRLR
ncbi:SDR family oxidoreductase [Lutibaculum baratangense]|uniref:Short-chain dehydrogenase/reductase SDR n=1 Tax=Lutibaculum baratangense AMV1 TaxID=631454 RepID=V4REK8_9HYPH|nr:SDR family oxidoreductase [Lutibaculum baratangense]ESR24576.1 short-chain dehydrogenase/reductase SDR [Lutibaculum baratangense AMV1]